MSMLNKITGIAAAAIISLIERTEYTSASEVYSKSNKLVGYKNNKILIADECLIRLYSIVEENAPRSSGNCEITTVSKDGDITGSMIIRVEVDDFGYGFRSPSVSTSDVIVDRINDNAEAIINALKSVI